MIDHNWGLGLSESQGNNLQAKVPVMSKPTVAVGVPERSRRAEKDTFLMTWDV